MDGLYIVCLAVAGLLIFVASLDDLIIDVLIALKLRAPRITPVPANDGNAKPKIAIFVANWQEAEVIGHMVEGNLSNLDYRPLTFVIGVYPNDKETRAVAEEAERKYPELVKVIVNRRDGPTSKGQMLNEMFAQLFADPDSAPDLVVMHDSEDMIDPRSFDVYRHHARDSALIQVPVFSLDSRHRSLVGATYMEEFAERHTREMLLRSQLGAFVPSAGVGTGLRKDLIEHLLNQRGYIFQAGSVTEDYVLGAEAHAAGFKTTFAAHRASAEPDAPIIATLEYFPKDFWASVKQKTRWVYGIAFESAFQLGWSGRGWNLFFQYRDRKGSIANLLPVLSLAILITGLAIQPDFSNVSGWLAPILWLILAANTINILIRILFRSLAFREVYGTYNILGLLLRWPVSFCVNAAAVARAWRMFVVDSGFATKPVAWSKTQHEVPDSFAFVGVLGTRAKLAPIPATRTAITSRASDFVRHPGFQITSAICLVVASLAIGSQFVAPIANLYAEQSNARVAARNTLKQLRINQKRMTENIQSARFAAQRYASLIMDATNNRSNGSIFGIISSAEPATAKSRAKFASHIQHALAGSADSDTEFLALVDFKRDSATGTKILLHTNVVNLPTEEPNKYSLLKSNPSPKTLAPHKTNTRQNAVHGARISLAMAQTEEEAILRRHKTALRKQQLRASKSTRKLAALAIAEGSGADNQILRLAANTRARLTPSAHNVSSSSQNRPTTFVNARVLQTSKQSQDKASTGHQGETTTEIRKAFGPETETQPSETDYNWAAAQIRSDSHDHILTLTQSIISAGKHQDRIFFDHIRLVANDEGQLYQKRASENAFHPKLGLSPPGKDTEAKFLARVALAASEKNDVAILQLKLETRFEDQSGRPILKGGHIPTPAQLTQVPISKRSKITLNEANDYNAEILSAMIDGVPDDSSSVINKPESTRAVFETQKRINDWLKSNNSSITRFGLTQPNKLCGNFLCADGVLGSRTKTLIERIAKTDQSFWRPVSQTKNKSTHP